MHARKLVLLAVVALLAACTDEQSAAPSVVSTAPGCQPGNQAPFDGPVPPEGATDVSEASADVDGDGRVDRVASYRRQDGARRVAVALAAGGTAAVDASTSAIEGPAPLSVLGGVDLGGGGETALAVTGAGASVVVVGLFQFVECSLTRVAFESGAEAELPVGGGVTHGDGLVCRDEELVVLSATSPDGETFTATETSYRVDGSTLVEVGSETSTLTRGADDEAINAYYTLDCPALERGLGPR